MVAISGGSTEYDLPIVCDCVSMSDPPFRYSCVSVNDIGRFCTAVWECLLSLFVGLKLSANCAHFFLHE